MDVEEFLRYALKEDIGDGDHTSLACIPENSHKKAKLLVKQPGILAGVDIALLIFKLVDPALKMTIQKKDSAPISIGDIVMYVEGSARSILQAERLVLNIMQRMSGIATATNRLVTLVKPYGTRILDTRKTTPGFRYFEKLAVKIGGGVNHRFGLYDMIMLKDNHIDYAGGVKEAIRAVKSYLKENKKSIKIEVEARNLQEVQSIMSEGGIDRIMLDNFKPSDMREAVQLIAGKYETEASGGITEENIISFAETGVDFISIGALTHTVKSLDLSLKAT